MKVDFYRRCRSKTEGRYVDECLESGLETDGPFTQRLTAAWGRLCPGSYSLFTTSCTTALETALGCLDLRPGDEVILPSFNFPSAANGALLHGGVPVLCDIDPDTQNISLKDMEGRIGPRTRAVVVVHYAGVSCPMEELKKTANAADIALIEDAAQGAGASWRGRALGTIGDFGAVSFHHTKNITCGEGGVLTTGSRRLWQRAGQYRLHGTNRAMYLAGEADRYTWNMPGSCTAMGELAASVLVSQLEILSEVTERRRRIAEGYRERLGVLEEKGLARLMAVPSYAEPNGHIFYLRFESEGQRDRVKEKLLELGVECKTHYVPLHMSPQGKKLGYKEGDLKESLRCYKTLLRLPIHGGMSLEAMEYAAGAVIKASGL